MKTNIFPKTKNYLYIGLLSLFMVSCGSYQNSSYYESDGIYSTSTDRNTERRNTNSDNYYKDYFNALQNDSQSSEVITDIDKYSDFDSVDNDSYTGYAGWGDNQTGTIVNIYPNYWGMNYGFGWNNWGWNNWGWNNWGMNYGFGWNNWGWNNWGMNYGFGWNNWGYNNWGWNNNYYYNRPNYSSYAPTRRRSVSNSANYSSGNRTYTPTRSYSTDRVNSRRATFTNPRTYNRNSNTNSTTTTRRSATQNTTTRQQSNYSRNESYTPSRSYSSPSSNSGSSGRSYGGSSSGGGSSRSSGGGRR